MTTRQQPKQQVKLTPQDIHQEVLLVDPDLPDDWAQLSEQQQMLFREMATRLNSLIAGDTVKRLPSRRTLITEHQRDLEDLQNAPVRLGDFTERFFAKTHNTEMQRYHTFALKYLQDGGDIAQTIDAMDGDELLEMMQQQGIHVCLSEDIED